MEAPGSGARRAEYNGKQETRNVRETILNILRDIRPDVDFENETGLVSGEVLESFDLLTIIASLQDELGVEIGNREINAENFDSLDAMCAMAERLTHA